MAPKTAINSEKGLKSPLFSQAVVHSGTVYVSGNIGADYTTMKLAGEPNDVYAQTIQALKNITVVLEEAGSGLQNMVKCNIYLTDMDTYAAMNKAYLEMIHDKPARTCVCVKELPFKAGVEIECIAHL